ncbi:hypothetical protein CPB85DRAFT_246491 [Mucidula mucida]|nr:hypothetical protein CPB85DRAFT_246491 [Mucidula mucida]
MRIELSLLRLCRIGGSLWCVYLNAVNSVLICSSRTRSLVRTRYSSPCLDMTCPCASPSWSSAPSILRPNAQMAHLSIAKWQDSLDKVVLLDEGNRRGIAAPASSTEGDTNAEGPACIEYVDHHLGCIGDTVICICQRWRRAALSQRNSQASRPL